MQLHVNLDIKCLSQRQSPNPVVNAGRKASFRLKDSYQAMLAQLAKHAEVWPVAEAKTGVWRFSRGRPFATNTVKDAGGSGEDSSNTQAEKSLWQ